MVQPGTGSLCRFRLLTLRREKIIRDMKKLLLLLSVVAAIWPRISAQMTLHDCLVFARDHSYVNRINRYEDLKADVDRKAALSSVLPYLGFDVSGNISFGRNIDPGTNTYDNKQTLSSGFGLGLSLPLFDGLVGFNGIKMAGMARRRRMKASQAEADRISLSVIRSFYNVAYCEAMVRQMTDALERDRRILHATEIGLATGTKSEADVADLRALVASDEYELTNQKNLLSKASLQLRADMGMELSDRIWISACLDDSVCPLPAARDGFIHPEIEEASYALAESRYGLRAARGRFSPVISLNAGISTSYYRMMGSGVSAPGFGRQWHDNMGQYIGVTFSFPLFDGLSSFCRVKRAGLDVRQNMERLEQTRFRIDKERTEAELDYYSACTELRSARTRLDAEQTAFNATSRKYELGGASAVDLYTSSAKLSVARANLEGKRIRMIISGIVLSYYNGRPLIDD